METTIQTGTLIQRIETTSQCESGQVQSDVDSSCEVAFHMPDINELHIKASKCTAKVTEYLEHQVYRNRRDLRCHVQRVYLHITRNDPESVHGAILDLFITLQDKGKPLRERLLKACRHYISVEQFDFFARKLSKGISDTDATLPVRTSLLTKGRTCNNPLVVRQVIQKDCHADPLVEARDHMQYGQVEEAQIVLEKAIIQTPQRTDLHLDLLDIYRHTQAVDAFHKMYQVLDSTYNPVTNAWQDLANHFARVS